MRIYTHVLMGDPSAVQDLIARTQPRIVIAEISFQKAVGFDLIKETRIHAPAAALLIYSQTCDDAFIEHCLRLGAMGFVSKSQPEGELITAIRSVLGGSVCLPGDQSSRLLARMVSSPGTALKRLSSSEFEVFHMIGRGMSNAEIAGCLHRSIKTIETYRSRIKMKLRIRTSSELAHFAFASQSASSGADGTDPSRSVANATAAQSRGSVLVVDDHAICRDPLTRLLSHHGFTAFSAADGIEALELLATQRFDVILTDLMMPRLDGIGFLEALRSKKSIAEVPVIVMTASMEEQMLGRARKLGNRLLCKSQFKIEELIRLVAELADPSRKTANPDAMGAMNIGTPAAFPAPPELRQAI